MSKRHIFPGFGLTLGWTLTYLSLIVLIPFSCLIAKTASGGWSHFIETVTSPQVVASYWISFGVSLVAALLNGIFGVLAAWVDAGLDFVEAQPELLARYGLSGQAGLTLSAEASGAKLALRGRVPADKPWLERSFRVLTAAPSEEQP